MDVQLNDVIIADKTKRIMWEQDHPLCYNTRTKEKMSEDNFVNVFNRKFRNLKDIPTITEILRLNKMVTEEAMSEFQALINWHKGIESGIAVLPQPPVKQHLANSRTITINPPFVEEDEEEEEEQFLPEPEDEMWESDDNEEEVDDGRVYTPSYPGQKSIRFV